MPLAIRLTRISPTHHIFEYQRGDGTGDRLELETKSFLFHDLLHFAVETEAGLQNSFYGLLSRSRSYNELFKLDEKAAGEIGMTERIVGALTGAIKQNEAPADVINIVKNFLDAMGETAPIWFTEDFILRVKERMRRLQGEWNATSFGPTMTLLFENKNTPPLE